MKKRLELRFRSIAVAALIASQGVIAIAADDPALLFEKAALYQARATGAQAQQSALQSRDSAALSSAECTAIEAAAKDAATAFVRVGEPVSTESIISNSTCFGSISQIKIPVNVTGIGFLDGIIGQVAKWAQSTACSKATAFVNDLKNSAINQISNGVKGALKINQLSAGGVDLGGVVNNAVGNEVNTAAGSLNQGTNTLINNVTNGVSQSATQPQAPTQSQGLFGNGSLLGGLFGG